MMDAPFDPNDFESTPYILEYNELQGHFHYNNGIYKEKTFGWETIFVDTYEQVKAFMDFLETNYERNDTFGFDNLSLEEVKQKYQEYKAHNA